MDINEAVLKYEKSRQLIKQLINDRGTLLGQCLYYDRFTGKSCINIAWDDLNLESLSGSVGFSDGIDIEESFFHHINDGKGACKHCMKAREIKKWPLRKARQDFGGAKRSIAHHGKNLIKAELCSK